MPNYNKYQEIRLSKTEVRDSMLINKALATVDEASLPSAELAGLDQLRALAKDYMQATIERSMPGDYSSPSHARLGLVANDPEATQYSDEGLHPLVDINRPELAEPLILAGDDAAIALHGLLAYAETGDTADKRQVREFLGSHLHTTKVAT